MPRERTYHTHFFCAYIYACNLSALENRHFEIYKIVIISETFVDLCMYVHTCLFSVCLLVIQVFTKSANSGDLTLGLLSVAKFSSSISQIYSRSTITGFYHIYKSSKISGNTEGKLGNRNLTEKNDDGGGVGWCVICSELSTKSTPVVDTRVFGRHGMMSGSSGA